MTNGPLAPISYPTRVGMDFIIVVNFILLQHIIRDVSILADHFMSGPIFRDYAFNPFPVMSCGRGIISKFCNLDYFVPINFQSGDILLMTEFTDSDFELVKLFDIIAFFIKQSLNIIVDIYFFNYSEQLDCYFFSASQILIQITLFYLYISFSLIRKFIFRSKPVFYDFIVGLR